MRPILPTLILVFAFAAMASCGARIDDNCGAGTYDDHGVCRASDGTIVCGAGTMLVHGTCVVAGEGGTGGDGSGTTTSGFDSGASSDGGVSALDSGFGIDVATACLTSDNIFIIAGDDWVHSGDTVRIEGGAGWATTVPYTADGLPSWVQLDVGTSWIADFSTKSLGAPLNPGTYDHAQNAYATDPNRPGLYVGGGGACDQLDGTFTVLEMTPQTDAGYPQVQSFTAYWQEHCVEGTGSDVGCIHFSR